MRPAHVEWDYTTFLNLVFLAVAAAVWWLARHRARFGGGVGYAIDPVCGMQVRIADAPSRVEHDGATVWFCADRCRDRFEADPDRFVPSANAGGGTATARPPDGPGSVTFRRDPTSTGAPVVSVTGDADPVTAVDPVCGMTVDPAAAAAHRVHDGVDHWFCCEGCAEQFDSRATKAR
jgi:YHS domain-containing protein